MHLTNKKFKIKNRQVKKDKGKLILSKNISVSLNDKSTNVCIIGGSGSQKLMLLLSLILHRQVHHT